MLSATQPDIVIICDKVVEIFPRFALVICGDRGQAQPSQVFGVGEGLVRTCVGNAEIARDNVEIARKRIISICGSVNRFVFLPCRKCARIKENPFKVSVLFMVHRQVKRIKDILILHRFKASKSRFAV